LLALPFLAVEASETTSSANGVLTPFGGQGQQEEAKLSFHFFHAIVSR
jgi:hypothetical protein